MQIPSPLQKLPQSLCNALGANLWVKRDDLIHLVISGNKYRKLRYNLDDLISQGFKQVLTFGGAHSNHIAATAYLCKKKNMDSIGIIRGEAPRIPSTTLQQASEFGMKLIHVSRSTYKRRNEEDYLAALRKQFPAAYLIPEGGANALGVKGCEDIVTECQQEIDFDFITVDCGTGATLAGMVRKLLPHQKAVGVQVLKAADFISKEVQRFSPSHVGSFEVQTDYHFGGYAKYQPELISFMQWFYGETGIKLDPIYTGKQFFAVFDLLKKGHFPKGATIVLTHTGGLQGIEGFEERYELKIY